MTRIEARIPPTIAAAEEEVEGEDCEKMSCVSILSRKNLLEKPSVESVVFESADVAVDAVVVGLFGFVRFSPST